MNELCAFDCTIHFYDCTTMIRPPLRHAYIIESPGAIVSWTFSAG